MDSRIKEVLHEKASGKSPRNNNNAKSLISGRYAIKGPSSLLLS